MRRVEYAFMHAGMQLMSRALGSWLSDHVSWLSAHM